MTLHVYVCVCVVCMVCVCACVWVCVCCVCGVCVLCVWEVCASTHVVCDMCARVCRCVHVEGKVNESDWSEEPPTLPTQLQCTSGRAQRDIWQVPGRVLQGNRSSYTPPKSHTTHSPSDMVLGGGCGISAERGWGHNSVTTPPCLCCVLTSF